MLQQTPLFITASPPSVVIDCILVIVVAVTCDTASMVMTGTILGVSFLQLNRKDNSSPARITGKIAEWFFMISLD